MAAFCPKGGGRKRLATPLASSEKGTTGRADDRLSQPRIT